MASEVVQFFREAFLDSLEEVTRTLPLPLPLQKEFDDAANLLKDDDRIRKIWQSPQFSEALHHDHLDHLNDALALCREIVQMQPQQQRRRPLILPSLSKWKSCISVLQMTNRLKSMNEKLKKFFEETDNSPLNPTIITPFRRHTRLEPDTSQITVDFGENEAKLKNLLLSNPPKYKAIGIYGMTGSGKTAIVQKILNLPGVGSTFRPIIWICLSDSTCLHDHDDHSASASNITKQILYNMGCDVDEWPVVNPTTSDLLNHLHQSLKSQRYLIVLDDVWKVNDFLSDLGRLPDTGSSRDVRDDGLWYGLPKDSGGTVIMTSRLKEVVQRMNTMIHMEPLERKKCKSLLLRKSELIFELYEQQIIELINSNNGYEAIGIYGPNSSENTRLIDVVLENPTVCKQFSPIIRVCVSEQDHVPDMILSCMLRQLQQHEIDVNKELEIPVSSPSSNKDLTHDFKTGLQNLVKFTEKKYLIVLEDMRHLDYWYSDLNCSDEQDHPYHRLAGALPMDGNIVNGGAVIVSTIGARHEAEYFVGRDHKTQKQRLIHVNSEKDAIQMEIKDPIILDLCGGLPLAATKIADIVRERKIPIAIHHQ